MCGNAVMGPTDAVEEEGLARLYPWQCYTGYPWQNATFQEFSSLEAMSASVKLDSQAIEYAIRHNQGNLGSYHFVKR